ncbi:MAG: ABC transporter permease [Acidobacteriota bacterium]
MPSDPLTRVSPLTRVGLLLLALLMAVSLAAPWIAPYDPLEQIDAAAGKHQPPLTVMAAVQLEHGRWRLADRVERGPDGVIIERLGQRQSLAASEVLNLDEDGVRDRRIFLLGTDKFGRDVLSRLLHASRVSLMIGILSVAMAIAIGVAVGALAALGGSLLDGLLMRLVDGILTLPWIFLLMTLTALFAVDVWMLIVFLGMTAWPPICRLVRAELLSLRERDFVLAARGLGLGEVRIFFRHMLPHALTPLVVAATLRIGTLILIEASLSFLGFGVQSPQPSWGNMIADGQGVLLTAWWVAAFPSALLVFVVVAVNLVGDGLRDRLDPTLQQMTRE